MQGAKLKPKEQLAAVFKEAGVDVSKPLVCSCGSGLTACILALAVYQVNGTLVPIYDGSWCEWGALDDTPIVTEI
jgi:thiosulfate/3-mercaptopyruvate sulfurtransferase